MCTWVAVDGASFRKWVLSAQGEDIFFPLLPPYTAHPIPKVYTCHVDVSYRGGPRPLNQEGRGTPKVLGN